MAILDKGVLGGITVMARIGFKNSLKKEEGEEGPLRCFLDIAVMQTKYLFLTKVIIYKHHIVK